ASFGPCAGGLEGGGTLSGGLIWAAPDAAPTAAAMTDRGVSGERPITIGRGPCGGCAAIKPWMRSSVSVVMRPPLRNREVSLPSLTARRPKVDSASPVDRQ